MPGPDKAEAMQANALGARALAEGQAAAARAHFDTAIAADPGQPALLFNLAAACRACGDNAGALAALDAALAADPYFVQALFQKAVLIEDGGDAPGAARIYRDFLDTAPPEVLGSDRFAAPLARARAAIEADGARIAAALGAIGPAPSARIAEAASLLTGLVEAPAAGTDISGGAGIAGRAVSRSRPVPLDRRSGGELENRARRGPRGVR